MEKKEYVNGFAFSFDERTVVLIRKNRPAWQAGHLNGVGGKIEPGETPEEAMRREFREETGVDIERWEKFLVHESPNHIMHCFRTTTDVWKCSSTTDEAVERWFVPNINEGSVIKNLLWMVPLALDREIGFTQAVIHKT